MKKKIKVAIDKIKTKLNKVVEYVKNNWKTILKSTVNYILVAAALFVTYYKGNEDGITSGMEYAYYDLKGELAPEDYDCNYEGWCKYWDAVCYETYGEPEQETC